MNPRIDGNSRGVFVIAPTPFKPDGELDLDSAKRMCDFYIEKGASGMTILGMMGEAPKLSLEESLAFTGTVLTHLDGKVPVVIGVSSPGMNLMADLSKAVMDQGAAGVMIAPPPTLKTDEQIFRYYEQCVALLGDTPICLQDYPQTLGVHFSAPLLVKIFKELPAICMLKHEDAPGLAKLSAFRVACEKEIDRRVSILVGNGGISLPQELARGADGAMTGFAFPEMLVQVVNLYSQGRTEDGENLFDAYLPLVRHELQPGIGLAIRKYILKERGAIAHDSLRAPGPKLTATDIAEVRGLWDRLEKRLQAM